MRADADGHRLLPDIGVAGAVDQPGLVGLGQLLLAAPDHQHLAIETQQRGLVQLRIWLMYHRVCYSYWVVVLVAIPPKTKNVKRKAMRLAPITFYALRF